MPILASLGTANDRAFGFGDSSFASGYALPAIITNNAEIIYDASNPASVRQVETLVGPLFSVFSSSEVTYGSNWYIPVPLNTIVAIGDTVNAPFPSTVVAIERNVVFNRYGLNYTGDRIVVDAPPAWGNGSITIYASATKWYDISGNNHHATFAKPLADVGYVDTYFLDTKKAYLGNWSFAIPTSLDASVGDIISEIEHDGQPVSAGVSYPIVSLTPHETNSDYEWAEVAYSGFGYVGTTKVRLGYNKPYIGGSGGNKYIVLENGNTLSIPSALTYLDGGFDIITVWKITGSNIDGVGWRSSTAILPYHLSFDSEGNGGFGGSSVDYPGYPTAATGQYVMLWGRIGLSGSGTNAVTKINAGTGGVSAGMTYSGSGIGSNSCVIGATATSEIKLIAIYPPGTAPTNINAYNALKGRFGL